MHMMKDNGKPILFSVSGDGAMPWDILYQPVRRKNSMIAVIFMFGPCHGHTAYAQAPLSNEIFMEEINHEGRFEQYRFGDPFLTHGSPYNEPMGTRRHVYKLHDVFDMDVEEGAVYFHHERCCDRTYEKSDDYKRNHIEMPRFKGHNERLMPTSKEFDEMAAKVKESARMQFKSEAYIKAVESNKRLIWEEKNK